MCWQEKNQLIDKYDASLELPATLKEINTIVENTAVKKKFNINSSIEVKTYFLNKNEKKLFKLDDFYNSYRKRNSIN